jgi:hypothetical protein
MLDQIPINGTKSISVAKAIVVGHLCVTGGVFVVIGVTVFVCRVFDLLNFPIAIGVGAIVAWPWWSLTVPKWRRWALKRGADAEQLQKVAVRTGLVWPRGCIFEKTEIPPRKW